MYSHKATPTNSPKCCKIAECTACIVCSHTAKLSKKRRQYTESMWTNSLKNSMRLSKNNGINA